MPSVSRIGDTFKAICCCHKHCRSVTGVIVTGSANVIANGSQVALLNAIGKATCGHTAIIVSASPNVVANSLGVARIGDVVTGCPHGTIVTGSPNVYANG